MEKRGRNKSERERERERERETRTDRGMLGYFLKKTEKEIAKKKKKRERE